MAAAADYNNRKAQNLQNVVELGSATATCAA